MSWIECLISVSAKRMTKRKVAAEVSKRSKTA